MKANVRAADEKKKMQSRLKTTELVLRSLLSTVNHFIIMHALKCTKQFQLCRFLCSTSKYVSIKTEIIDWKLL